MHLMSFPYIVFRQPSIHKCPFVCQHMNCWHSDGEVPFALITPLATMPTRDYLKYMPKFTGEGDFTVEEHLEAFYSYAKNINIEQADVWTKIFVQSLNDQARKWFKELHVGSLECIEALDDIFLKHWEERRDHLYYITKFNNLKRKWGVCLQLYQNIQQHVHQDPH